MSTTTLTAPAAMLGRVHRVPEPTPRYRIEVRAICDGREQVTRTFAFWDLARAQAQFDAIRRLGGRTYSCGRYRLVLIDTANHAGPVPAYTEEIS